MQFRNQTQIYHNFLTETYVMSSHATVQFACCFLTNNLLSAKSYIIYLQAI